MSGRFKNLIAGTAATFVLCAQLSGAALAATDQEAFEAAQAGIEYLAANQNADGSVSGFGGETEWSVVAITAGGQDAANFKQAGGVSAEQFLKDTPLADTAPATDVERKVLAITAAKEDLSTFGGVDYTAALQNQHNNSQIGDPTLLNDDIFGVIAVDAATDSSLQALAQDGLDYFLSHQQTDGGFSYTTDTCAFCGSDSNDTAAAIIAMYSAENLGLANADLASGKDKAIVYLLSTQQTDGGFSYDVFSPSDGSSTAWGLMALNVIGASAQTEAQAARNWLLANQNADGGFSYGAFGFTDSSTSITAHAILALLGSSWLLRPEPLHLTKQNPSADQPAQTSSASTTNQTGIAQTAAATGSSATTPQSPQTGAQESSETNPQETTQTKAAQTENTGNHAAHKDTSEKSSSNPNYALYGIPALAVIAGGWYVLQSRNKQEA